MSIDFAKLAADTTVAADADFPSAATTRQQGADPALVQLVTDAKDGKRRELPGRFSTTPYEGRKGANEAGTVAGQLHKAAHQASVKIAVRRFDVTAEGARLTFKVAK